VTWTPQPGRTIQHGPLRPPCHSSWTLFHFRGAPWSRGFGARHPGRGGSDSTSSSARAADHAFIGRGQRFRTLSNPHRNPTLVHVSTRFRHEVLALPCLDRCIITCMAACATLVPGNSAACAWPPAAYPGRHAVQSVPIEQSSRLYFRGSALADETNEHGLGLPLYYYTATALLCMYSNSATWSCATQLLCCSNRRNTLNYMSNVYE
jgi:hypothetical protein